MKFMGLTALWIAVASSAVGCGNSGGVDGNSTVDVQPKRDSTQPEASPLTADPAFNESVRKWKDGGIRSYDLTATLFEGGMRGYAHPVIISVRDGAYASIKAVKKDNLAGMDGYAEFNTVEKMFDVIRSHLNDEFPAKVKYNEIYGYPEKINLGNPRYVDAWRSFEILNFVVVPSADDESQPKR